MTRIRSDLDSTVHELSEDDAQEARCGRRVKEGENWWLTEDEPTHECREETP
jgi:hypothetical protein